jgi:transposase
MENAMTPLGSVAGIDVSKAVLDVGLMPSGEHWREPNRTAGIVRVVERLLAAKVGRVALEATGGLEYPVARALADAGLEVIRVNPDRIHGFRKSLGQRAKTDKLDAALIARFAAVMDEPSRPLPSLAAQAIKDLAARRRQLVEMIAMEKNRLKAIADPAILDSVRLVIQALSAERARIEKALARAIAQDPAAQRRFEILTSVPGIGPVAATTLITEMPELGALDRRAAASLAGLAPHPDESGTTRKHARLRGGRPCVRTALYMGALTTRRLNPDAKAFYDRLLVNGKTRKQAALAVARKLVTLANQLLRENRRWTPNSPANP